MGGVCWKTKVVGERERERERERETSAARVCVRVCVYVCDCAGEFIIEGVYAPMQAYEIYDADTGALCAERDRLRALCALGGEDAAAQSMLAMVMEELDERAVSDAVLRECASVYRCESMHDTADMDEHSGIGGRSPASAQVAPTPPHDEGHTIWREDEEHKKHAEEDTYSYSRRERTAEQNEGHVLSPSSSVRDSGDTRQQQEQHDSNENEHAAEVDGTDEQRDDDDDAPKAVPRMKHMSVVEAAEAAFKAEKRAARRASLHTAEVKGLTKREAAMQQARMRSFAGRKALQEEVFVHKKQMGPAPVAVAIVDTRQHSYPASTSGGNGSTSTKKKPVLSTPVLRRDARDTKSHSLSEQQAKRELFPGTASTSARSGSIASGSDKTRTTRGHVYDTKKKDCTPSSRRKEECVHVEAAYDGNSQPKLKRDTNNKENEDVSNDEDELVRTEQQEHKDIPMRRQHSVASRGLEAEEILASSTQENMGVVGEEPLTSSASCAEAAVIEQEEQMPNTIAQRMLHPEPGTLHSSEEDAQTSRDTCDAAHESPMHALIPPAEPAAVSNEEEDQNHARTRSPNREQQTRALSSAVTHVHASDANSQQENLSVVLDERDSEEVDDQHGGGGGGNAYPDDESEVGCRAEEEKSERHVYIDYDKVLPSDDELGSDIDGDDDNDDTSPSGAGHLDKSTFSPNVSPTSRIRRYFAHDADEPSLSSMLRGRHDKDMCEWADSRSGSPDDVYARIDTETHNDGRKALQEALIMDAELVSGVASPTSPQPKAVASHGDNLSKSMMDIRIQQSIELLQSASARTNKDATGLMVTYTDMYTSFEDILTSTTGIQSAQRLSASGSNANNNRRQSAHDKRPSSSEGQNLYREHIAHLEAWMQSAAGSHACEKKPSTTTVSDSDRSRAISSSSSSAVGSHASSSLSSKRIGVNSSIFYIPRRGESHHAELMETIGGALTSLGWKEQPAGSQHCWNVMWSWSTRVAMRAMNLFAWQFINHYPNARNLTRKDLLSGHLQRHMAVHGATTSQSSQKKKNTTSLPTFDIVPQTFALPKDYTRFCEVMTERQIDIELEREKRKGGSGGDVGMAADADTRIGMHAKTRDNVWIMKPVGLSRGRGIFLVDDLSTVSFTEPMIIQKYISNPLLIKGFKFDLRLYVLVTSFKPLECWISSLGFARFASKPYECSSASLSDTFIHLTNTSLQKDYEDHSLSDCLGGIIGEDGKGGTKAALSAAFSHLRKERGDADVSTLWKHIKAAVVTSLFAVEDSMAHSPNCFELFGYDVLIDDSLRPWLIEVNSSPQLDAPTKLDVDIKQHVIRDVIGVLQPAAFCREQLVNVLRRRLANAGKRAAASQGCTKGITMAEERSILNEDIFKILV